MAARPSSSHVIPRQLAKPSSQAMETSQAARPVKTPFSICSYWTVLTPKQGEAMTPQVWSAMPFEILKVVLLRLPLASQARLRAVSKAFLCLLSSRKFQLESAKIAVSCGRLPLCALVQSGQGVLPSQKVDDFFATLQSPYKLHKVSLGFLPPEVRDFIRFNRSNANSCDCIRVNGNGVVFFVNPLEDEDWRANHQIFLVNPLNQTWRRLPDLRVDIQELSSFTFSPLVTSRTTLQAMSFIEGVDGSFEIFVLHIYMFLAGSRYYPTFTALSIYSSKTHGWRTKYVDEGDCDTEMILVNALNTERIAKFCALRLVEEDVRAINATTVAPPLLPLLFFRHGYVDYARYELFSRYLIQLEPEEGMVAKIHGIFSSTEDSSEKGNDQQWSRLPRALTMEMAPDTVFDSRDDYPDIDESPQKEVLDLASRLSLVDHDGSPFVCGLQFAGSLAVVTELVATREHVVVHDLLSGAWKSVLRFSQGGEQLVLYLEPRPDFRVGMEDCPPDSASASG